MTTVPPHCDALDGPVVRAARAALDAHNVSLVLPYVHRDGETEVRAAFSSATRARDEGADARQVAEQWFFETVVRLHRMGEGAEFTGLKPAGLDVGPVIPVAERAAAKLSGEELADLLAHEVRMQVQTRVDHIRELSEKRSRSVEDDRQYVEAVLGLQVFSHELYRAMQDGHGH